MIESKITKIFRDNLSFRFILIDSEIDRIGSKGLESSLIGTIASCKLCKPSDNWLGNYSPKKQIKENGLWLIQHLKDKGLNENDKEAVLNGIRRTIEWSQWVNKKGLLK